jgi:hypothetical protein
MAVNNGVEALGRTRRQRGGSRDDSMMARASERLTTAWTPGKFLARNFGSLKA